jgi:hypothetical protein
MFLHQTLGRRGVHERSFAPKPISFLMQKSSVKSFIFKYERQSCPFIMIQALYNRWVATPETAPGAASPEDEEDGSNEQSPDQGNPAEVEEEDEGETSGE